MANNERTKRSMGADDSIAMRHYVDVARPQYHRLHTNSLIRHLTAMPERIHTAAIGSRLVTSGSRDPSQSRVRHHAPAWFPARLSLISSPNANPSNSKQSRNGDTSGVDDHSRTIDTSSWREGEAAGQGGSVSKRSDTAAAGAGEWVWVPAQGMFYVGSGSAHGNGNGGSKSNKVPRYG